MNWILIVMMHVGALGSGDSNALTSINGFETQAACIKAGEAAAHMASNTVKEIKFVCAQSK